MASLDNQHPTVTRQLTYLFLTLFYLDSLIGLLVFIDQMSKKLTFLDFLAPYDQWLALADVAIFGWLAIGSGSRWAHSMAVAYTSADTAGVVRIILRIVATGVLVSRVPGSGVRGRGSGERETTASSLAGKEESSRKEDNSAQGKDGPAGAIAQGGNGR